MGCCHPIQHSCCGQVYGNFLAVLALPCCASCRQFRRLLFGAGVEHASHCLPGAVKPYAFQQAVLANVTANGTGLRSCSMKTRQTPQYCVERMDVEVQRTPQALLGACCNSYCRCTTACTSPASSQLKRCSSPQAAAASWLHMWPSKVMCTSLLPQSLPGWGLQFPAALPLGYS